MKWRFLFSNWVSNPLAYSSFGLQYIKLIFSPCHIKIFTWLPSLESDSFPNIGISGLFWQHKAVRRPATWSPSGRDHSASLIVSARKPLGSIINHTYEKTAIRCKTEQPASSLLPPSLKDRKITVSQLLLALSSVQQDQSLTPLPLWSLLLPGEMLTFVGFSGSRVCSDVWM